MASSSPPLLSCHLIASYFNETQTKGKKGMSFIHVAEGHPIRAAYSELLARHPTASEEKATENDVHALCKAIWKTISLYPKAVARVSLRKVVKDLRTFGVIVSLSTLSRRVHAGPRVNFCANPAKFTPAMRSSLSSRLVHRRWLYGNILDADILIEAFEVAKNNDVNFKGSSTWLAKYKKSRRARTLVPKKNKEAVRMQKTQPELGKFLLLYYFVRVNSNLLLSRCEGLEGQVCRGGSASNCQQNRPAKPQK